MEKKENKQAELNESPAFEAKTIQKEAAKKSKEIKLNDRIELEIIADSGFYKKGQIVKPHRIYGEEMIKNGFAKEVK